MKELRLLFKALQIRWWVWCINHTKDEVEVYRIEERVKRAGFKMIDHWHLGTTGRVYRLGNVTIEFEYRR